MARINTKLTPTSKKLSISQGTMMNIIWYMNVYIYLAHKVPVLTLLSLLAHLAILSICTNAKICMARSECKESISSTN